MLDYSKYNTEDFKNYVKKLLASRGIAADPTILPHHFSGQVNQIASGNVYHNLDAAFASYALLNKSRWLLGDLVLHLRVSGHDLGGDYAVSTALLSHSVGLAEVKTYVDDRDGISDIDYDPVSRLSFSDVFFTGLFIRALGNLTYQVDYMFRGVVVTV